jgi:DNA-directed RNA polymerase subunit omega
MNPELVKSAVKVVPNQQVLVNMVSRRVRQLSFGHRPMVEFAPGLGHADVALTEISEGKLTFELVSETTANGAAADVVQFPGVIVTKKAKRPAAAA